MNENPGTKTFKGVWIRKSLWERRDLTWFEKCLLCEIDSFDTCFASNKYLGRIMGTTEQVIQNSISKFRGAGLILDWGERGRKRQLTVADCVASDPRNPPAPEPQSIKTAKPLGLPPPNPNVYIDTSVDTSVRKKENEELLAQAATIYKEYPKRVGKPDALRSIIKKLRKYEFTELLEKTISYAIARRGENPQFTPNPSTWFNQERFNDDISTWSNGDKAKSSSCL